MAIHEVVYDTKDRIVRAKNVDDQVKLAIEHPLGVSGNQGQTTKINRHPSFVEFISRENATDGTSSIAVHIIAATSPNSIVDSESGYYKGATRWRVGNMTRFSREQINNPKLTIPDRSGNGTRNGFFWTPEGGEVDVFLGPHEYELKPSTKRRRLLNKLKTLLAA